MNEKGKSIINDRQVSDLSSFENGGDIFYYREDCLFKNM